MQMLQGVLLIGAVLYFGRELLVPLVLAVLLSFVLAPLVRLLRRIAGAAGRWAVILTVIFACAVIGRHRRAGRPAGHPAGGQPAELPVHHRPEAVRAEERRGLLDRISGAIYTVGHGVVAQEVAQPARPAPPPTAAEAAAGPPVPVEIRTPDPTAVEVLQRVATPLLGPLATAGMVSSWWSSSCCTGRICATG